MAVTLRVHILRVNSEISNKTHPHSTTTNHCQAKHIPNVLAIRQKILTYPCWLDGEAFQGFFGPAFCSLLFHFQNNHHLLSAGDIEKKVNNRQISSVDMLRQVIYQQQKLIKEWILKAQLVQIEDNRVKNTQLVAWLRIWTWGLPYSNIFWMHWGGGGAVLAYQEKLFIKTNVNDLGNKSLHSHSPPPSIIIIVIILIKHSFFWVACCSLP